MEWDSSPPGSRQGRRVSLDVVDSRQGSAPGSRTGSRCCSREYVSRERGGSDGSMLEATFPSRPTSKQQKLTFGSHVEILPTIPAGHSLEGSEQEATRKPRRGATCPAPIDSRFRMWKPSQVITEDETDKTPLSTSPRNSIGLPILPRVPSSKPALPPDPTPVQFSCGDMGHAASLIARGRQTNKGNLKSCRQILTSKHLTIPAIRTMHSMPLMSPDNHSILRAPVYPQMQRKVAVSPEVAAKTLTACIRGLKRANSQVSTEEITQRLLLDGWLPEEVQETLALGRIQLKAMQSSTRVLEPKQSATSFFSAKLNKAIKAPTLSPPPPPVTRSELLCYLKKKLQALPVSISNSTSDGTGLHNGCTVLMHFGDHSAAQAAVAHLHTKIKAVNDFRRYRAFKEGPFVKLVIDDYGDQEEVDKITETLREIHTFGVSRRREQLN